MLDTATQVTINELVNDALLLYSGLALKPKSNYFDRQLIEELNASRELDPSGLTTFMLLRGQTDLFLDEATFSARKVLHQTKSFAQEIADIRRLLSLVEDAQIVTLIEEFQAQLRQMSQTYKCADAKAFEQLVTDKDNLAVLRRNALRSMQTLTPHQFMQGPGDPAPLKVHGNVYEFWNMNSLIAALRDQSYAGVSLCLIRDPAEVMASYFCFAVRNGDTLTVLTDRQEGPHPLYYQMTRKPDRILIERAERHHFPYQLLDLKPVLDGAGDIKGWRAAQREQLVPINTAAAPLKKLGELDADQFIWAGLVLTLLAEKYGGAEPLLLPETTYTGQMVVEPQALVSAAGSLVRTGQYQLLEMPPLTAADVTAETTAPQWRRPATGVHEWMVERYGAQVPDAVLNVVGERQAKQLKGQHAKGLTGMHDGGMFGRHDREVKFEGLSPVTFGSKEKLERDRVWAARMNQCRMVQALADKEYKKEKPKVMAWMRERAQANREYILNAAAAGKIDLPDIPFRNRRRRMDIFDNKEPDYSYRALMQCVNSYFPSIYIKVQGEEADAILGHYEDYERHHWRCADTGQAASLLTVITPTCPEAIAQLFGVSVDDLHFGLRNYHKHEPYSGNPILDRIDPSDWELDNPWLQLRVQVCIALSKTATNTRRRAQGLTPYGAADWAKLKYERNRGRW